MKSLILLPRAELDVIETGLDYETAQEGLGSAFERELGFVIERVRSTPQQFPVLERDVRRAMLDRFPYGIFFLVEDATVVVFAVLHLQRDPETWRSRR